MNSSHLYQLCGFFFLIHSHKVSFSETRSSALFNENTLDYIFSWITKQRVSAGFCKPPGQSTDFLSVFISNLFLYEISLEVVMYHRCSGGVQRFLTSRANIRRYFATYASEIIRVMYAYHNTHTRLKNVTYNSETPTLTGTAPPSPPRSLDQLVSMSLHELPVCNLPCALTKKLF